MELFSKKLTFVQDGDTCDSNNTQELNVEIIDGGAGAYVVISTTRWALDEKDFNDFVNMLKNEMKNVGLDKPYSVKNETV